MITYFQIVKKGNNYTCINKNDDYAEIVGGVFSTPTAAFYYALKELDRTHEGPFIVKYYRKKWSMI